MSAPICTLCRGALDPIEAQDGPMAYARRGAIEVPLYLHAACFGRLTGLDDAAWARLRQRAEATGLEAARAFFAAFDALRAER